MYSQIDIFQYGEEYYFFRKPSSVDLSQRFGVQGARSDLKQKRGGDRREYSKECAAVTLDFSDPSFEERLTQLEFDCGPGRNVERIVVEGPMAFQQRWMLGRSLIERFSKLTRTLQMNSVAIRHIPDFDLSHNLDSLKIVECGVEGGLGLLHAQTWFPFVARHLLSGKLAISRWVIEVHRLQDDQARLNDVRMFSDTIRRFSVSPIYLLVQNHNRADLNETTDRFVDGYIVLNDDIEYAQGKVRRDVISRSEN
jgi:hypothetical protein